MAVALFLALLATATNFVPWGRGADLALHAWVVAHRQNTVLGMAAVLTNLGASWVTIPLVAVVAFATTTADVRRRITRTAVVVAVMVSGALCRWGLAELIARPRPPRHDWAVSAYGLAFPSGHTTEAALAAGLMAWLLARRVGAHWLILAGAVGYAVVVGATRVYLGVHWPTDVLGGWAFAAAWLALVRLALPVARRPT